MAFEVQHFSIFMISFLFSAFYFSYLAIYRLYLSPIAKFPGPRLAALTMLYESYYDVVKGGQYTFKLRELHKKYGPIVRINPWELHIDDPDFHSTLYSREGRWDKFSLYCDQFGPKRAEVFTEDHDLHKARRASLSPFFSRQKVLSSEAMISDKLDKLCKRIQTYRDTKEILPVRLAYECLTMDIVIDYTLSTCYDNLDSPDWNADFHNDAESGRFQHFVKLYPIIIKILMAIAPVIFVVAEKLNPKTNMFFKYLKDTEAEVKRIREGREAESKAQPTVYEEILSSTKISDSDKDPFILRGEAIQLISGGTDTLSNTLHVLTYHLIDQPAVLERLRDELRTVQPDPMSPVALNELEHLPFLTGCLMEALRLGFGISTRSARIAPNRVIRYGDWDIPPGTPVGMTAVLIHMNEKIFPEPETFNPERWLDPTERKRLERYMVAFSKGTRACVGITLAWAELYMISARIFSRFDFKLHENTTYDDHVKLASDYFFPQPKGGTAKFCVLVK